LCMLTFSTTFV